jgi:uncharacterized membrane protein
MLIPTIIVLSIIGALISAYLTWIELITVVGTCPLSGFLSCSKVLFGPYSKFFGIPVAFGGLVWFLVAMALASGIKKRGNWMLALLVVWSGIGLAGVLVLFFVEAFLVDEICLYCTSAHAIGLAVIGLTFLIWSRRQRTAFAR